ncbi:5152_t:CDS:2 [Diversispora eburnea]|uniref:acylphosphatase n=1 Tax=Diversispora eburnea TaxID=1213867 RepID=A0A9N9GFY4_9GLOM|nr:5152_t:CDS:2 [Diversispora eburnea]
MLVNLTYEVFGKVQVFFRKFTKDKAIELQIVGWVKNTEYGSVTGIAQGAKKNINVFKKWIQYEGSPYSRIDTAKFKEEEIEILEFTNFEVRH